MAAGRLPQKEMARCRALLDVAVHGLDRAADVAREDGVDHREMVGEGIGQDLGIEQDAVEVDQPDADDVDVVGVDQQLVPVFSMRRLWKPESMFCPSESTAAVASLLMRSMMSRCSARCAVSTSSGMRRTAAITASRS